MTIQDDVLSTLEKAKLSQGELARACGLSRAMINKYCTGKCNNPERKQKGARLSMTLDTINKLVEMNKLPLSEDATYEKRRAAMDKIRLILLNAE